MPSWLVARITLAFFLVVSLRGICTAAVSVSTVSELVAAVTAANSGGDSIILVNNGTYDLNGEYLRITADNVTVRSAGGNRSAVTLDGNYVTTEIFQIVASNVIIADMTLQKAQDHPIHVIGADDRDISGILIDNVHIIDPGQQAGSPYKAMQVYKYASVTLCNQLKSRLRPPGRRKL
ncbi:hypothetical protein VU01_13862 [Candidatus Electrothrix marina]|uniref:Pectate lyase n=1 Tax=Candidatus Electrothrix marina TaxID=1859130 RepID=A0A444JAQ8_9BACT|nr:hypothetical protein VU01_13862 [Candidatus Electrothrix marina]